MQHAEHSWNLDTWSNRPEKPWKYWNVVLEKDGEDRCANRLWNEVLHRVEEERNFLCAIKARYTIRVDHILRRNCPLNTSVTGGRGRRYKQLLDHLKETTGYWYLNECAPDRILLGTSFGRGYGPVVWQTMERWWIILLQQNLSWWQTDHPCHPRFTFTVRHFSFLVLTD
jgi:hypothetical protein